MERRILAGYDENIQIIKELISPGEHINCGIDYLRDAANNFYSHIPRWLEQPRYLEVWSEKAAMGSVLYSILNGATKVIVAPNRGWSSYTFAKDNLARLLNQQHKGKEIFVQYYGDSDPSGD